VASNAPTNYAAGRESSALPSIVGETTTKVSSGIIIRPAGLLQLKCTSRNHVNHGGGLRVFLIARSDGQLPVANEHDAPLVVVAYCVAFFRQ